MIQKELKAAVQLEARLAALFVQTASKFRSRQTLLRGTHEANCKSIMGIISMSIREGDALTITATGPDAAEAADALSRMLAAV